MKPQSTKLIELFRQHQWMLTLRDIMRTELAAEYRARITELRHEGFTIVCIRGKTPSENSYSMTLPPQ